MSESEESIKHQPLIPEGVVVFTNSVDATDEAYKNDRMKEYAEETCHLGIYDKIRPYLAGKELWGKVMTYETEWRVTATNRFPDFIGPMHVFTIRMVYYPREKFTVDNITRVNASIGGLPGIPEDEYYKIPRSNDG